VHVLSYFSSHIEANKQEVPQKERSKVFRYSDLMDKTYRPVVLVPSEAGRVVMLRAVPVATARYVGECSCSFLSSSCLLSRKKQKHSKGIVIKSKMAGIRKVKNVKI